MGTNQGRPQALKLMILYILITIEDKINQWCPRALLFDFFTGQKTRSLDLNIGTV